MRQAPRSDFGNAVQFHQPLVPHREYRIQRGDMFAECLRFRRADVWDAQSNQHPPRIPLHARGDCIKKLLRCVLAHAIERGNLRELQAIKLRCVAHQTFAHQLRRQRRIAALNIHRSRRRPQHHAFQNMRRTIWIGAMPNAGRVVVAGIRRQLRPALRTSFRGV